jgi:hypothetical protein
MVSLRLPSSSGLLSDRCAFSWVVCERLLTTLSPVDYNTTDTEAKKDGFFDYYDQPSKNARRLAIMSMYLRKAVTNPDASLTACGERWNCTYQINFEAPGYKCDEIANSSKPDAGSAPFNLSRLAPEGSNLYYGDVMTKEYRRPQVETGEGGMPVKGPPYPDLLGVFQVEPVIWIGHSIKTSKPYDESSPYHERWDVIHEPKIFKCVSHHTNYTFEMKYNDTVQTHTLKSREFLRPTVDTTVLTDKDDDDIEDVIANPETNFVRPINAKEYKEIASYHALGQLLRSFLGGEVIKNGTGAYTVTKSDISETRLMDPVSSYPLSNLMEEIQNVFQDMLITLLSEPHLVVGDQKDVPCIKSRSVNVFVYHREGLWIGYALAVTITFGSILAGAFAMYQNGVASDTLFSRIMVTTRNPTLDRLSVGACLGGDPFPKDLTKTKLRFGVLLEEDPREGPLGKVEHCCFGAAGEVKDITKNGTYAGLKKYRKDMEEEEGNISEKAALLENDAA